MTTAAIWAQTPEPGKQVEQTLKVSDGATVPYLLYLPKDYGNGSAKMPLMLFLHGRGESDGPLSIVKKWGPPRLVERGEPLPYILVSPQCPRADFWNSPKQQKELLELLNHVKRTFRVDEDRMYLTGLSMGGYGSWQMAADHPELFAAVVPVCGKGNPENGANMKYLPIWAWHGTDDKAVPFRDSVEMVEALKKAGSTSVRFTSLEWIGHNSWEAAYATPELYDWLNQQTATKNRERAQADAK